MKGVPVKTPERVELAREMRAEGKTYREIGELLGCALTTVNNWICDPDGERLRVRRQQHAIRAAGECVDCGASIDGTHPGRGNPERRCQPCAHVEARVWTDAAIVLAIQEWAHEHDAPPALPDWEPQQARLMNDETRAQRWLRENAAGRWPSAHTTILRFGSWNAAIRAAGFEPRPSHGGGGNQYRRRSMRVKEDA